MPSTGAPRSLRAPTRSGAVWAISAETGETAWVHEQRAATMSLVTTGGGLVFGGDVNGRFRAFDQETGEVLWEVNLGSSVSGFPITYAVDGRQYVAVSTGTQRFVNLTPELSPSQGNNLFVFALPQPAVKLAFEFLVLTAARSAEVRLATWDEMDLAGRVWTVPALRMKAKREHRVPLCGRAVEILDAARTLGDGAPLVFPMRSGKAISSSTLPKMLQYQRIAAVAHGFRSSFRDWAAEETDHPREVIEAALAHVVQNKVEAAYARSYLFKRRRRLMDDWASYLGGNRSHERVPAVAAQAARRF